MKRMLLRNENEITTLAAIDRNGKTHILFNGESRVYETNAIGIVMSDNFIVALNENGTIQTLLNLASNKKLEDFIPILLFYKQIFVNNYCLFAITDDGFICGYSIVPNNPLIKRIPNVKVKTMALSNQACVALTSCSDLICWNSEFNFAIPGSYKSITCNTLSFFGITDDGAFNKITFLGNIHQLCKKKRFTDVSGDSFSESILVKRDDGCFIYFCDLNTPVSIYSDSNIFIGFNSIVMLYEFGFRIKHKSFNVPSEDFDHIKFVCAASYGSAYSLIDEHGRLYLCLGYGKKSSYIFTDYLF